MPKENTKPEEQKAAERERREKQREISLSPLALLKPEFTDGLEGLTDVQLGAEEIKARCFEVLHLIDQYHRPPKTKEELEATRREFAAQDTKALIPI